MAKDNERLGVDFSDVGFLLEASQDRGQQGRGRQSRSSPQSQRKKVTLKLNPALLELADLVAVQEQTSRSGIVDLFLEMGLRAYSQGRLDDLLAERKATSRSPAYNWIILVTVGDLPQKIKEGLRGA